jgi:hypothetical protein
VSACLEREVREQDRPWRPHSNGLFGAGHRFRPLRHRTESRLKSAQVAICVLMDSASSVKPGTQLNTGSPQSAFVSFPSGPTLVTWRVRVPPPES